VEDHRDLNPEEPMRLPLIPREEKFYDMFVEDAANVLAAARTLETFFSTYDQRERIAAQLQELEHQGDQLSHDIGHKLEETFVTPFDREDIHALISGLDDILDLIEEVADTCILYRISEPTDAARQQAEIVTLQCIQIREALSHLRDFRRLDQYWVEIQRLENEGDQVVLKAVAGLFQDGESPLEIIKWKDVYDLLENAIDACEDVANVIERIVVKHA
jgi:predicted phosphate transport protein (TIGR00153 family)